MADNEEDIQQEENEENEQNQDGNSSSDTSSENEELATQEEPKPEVIPEWRKGRLGTTQYALKKFDRLYSRFLRECIQKTEGSVNNSLQLLIKDAMEAKLEQNGPSDDLGYKLLKVLFMIKRISENFVISLKTPEISGVLAKTFQFLLKIEKNWIIGARILKILNQLRFDALDLKETEKTLSEPAAIDWLVDYLFEESLSKDTDLRIGNENKGSAIRTFLGILPRVSNAFKSSFTRLYSHMKRRRLEIFSSDGVRFRTIFFPIKSLEKADFDSLMNELITMLKTDSKISSKTTTGFLAQAVKNPNFKPNEVIMRRLVSDLDSLPVELMRERAPQQNKYIGLMANLLTRLIIRPTSPEDASMALNAVAGYIDCIVDSFHPKSQFSLRKMYYQKLVQQFLAHYIREAKKLKKKYPAAYVILSKELHPILKRVLNFSLFDKFTTSLEVRIMYLAYLEPEYFVEYFLNKIQFGFSFHEFRKFDLIKALESLSDIVPNDPAYIQNLNWILPKLLNELDNSTESSSVNIVSNSTNPR